MSSDGKVQLRKDSHYVRFGRKEKAVRLKMNAIRPIIEGHRLVLVDDSIVRAPPAGDREHGPKSRGKGGPCPIGSPPILAPCYLGIDMDSARS